MAPLSFSAALIQAEAQARSTLAPELHERLSAAVSLVTDGRVFQATDGTWQVESASSQGLTYAVNGVCTCDDVHYKKPPQGLCKHRLSVYLARRVAQLMQPPPAPQGGSLKDTTPLLEAPHGIDARHIVMIQGKPFVKFAGLLDLAHRRGLTALKVNWSYNSEDLSLAHAVAVFPFGTFAESGDATKDNVNKKVAPHFRRCALTRAAARCLRLALGLDMVAVEELDE